MQPIDETKERLFPSLPRDQLRFFSCGHIIPSENILPVAVEHGPSGQPLDFSFKCRSSPTMVRNLEYFILYFLRLLQSNKLKQALQHHCLHSKKIRRTAGQMGFSAAYFIHQNKKLQKVNINSSGNGDHK